MADQGSGTETPPAGEAPKGGSTEGEAPKVVPESDFLALQAQLTQLTQKIGEVESDAAKLREEKRKRKQETEEALKKAGEFEPLLQERDQRIAELEAKVADLEPHATAERARAKQEEAAFAESVKDLPQDTRDALMLLPTLAARRTLLAQIKAAAPSRTPPPPEHPAGAPSQPVTPQATLSDGDFIAAEVAKGRDLGELKKLYPDKWKAYMSSGKGQDTSGSALVARIRGLRR